LPSAASTPATRTVACTASTSRPASSPGASRPATTSTPAPSPPVPRTRSRPFGSYDGNFYALDARTGNERWSQHGLGSISGAASLIGDTVYVADLQTTSTYGFDVRNGHKVLQYTDGAYNPVISNGKDIFLTGYKTIYDLTPAQGPAENGFVQKPEKKPKKKAKGKKKG
jgi:hypothetical protein